MHFWETFKALSFTNFLLRMPLCFTTSQGTYGSYGKISHSAEGKKTKFFSKNGPLRLQARWSSTRMRLC